MISGQSPVCQLDTSLIYLPISDIVGYCVFYQRTSARNERGADLSSIPCLYYVHV